MGERKVHKVINALNHFVEVYWIFYLKVSCLDKNNVIWGWCDCVFDKLFLWELIFLAIGWFEVLNPTSQSQIGTFYWSKCIESFI